MSADSHSITLLLEQLRQEDPHAAGQIWQRFFSKLIPLARAKLRALPHRAVDEEDILVSVFDRFFQAAQQDRFVRLQDRDDLWQILFLLTERKVADEYRAAATQKRGGANTFHNRADPQASDLQDLADREPGPEFVAALNDQLARALARLGEPTTREVAILRMEGYQNHEIADRLQISLSSVERKLRVIREVWQEEFAD